MPDLIFHLGLTKNASSFMQAKIFKGKLKTLKRAVEWEVDREEALEFQKFFEQSDPQAWQDPSIARRFFDHDEEMEESVVISHESLYKHIPFNNSEKLEPIKSEPHTLCSRLKAIDTYCWPHGKTKVFFFYRRQADWLPSVYAHVCYRLSDPGQKDFDERLERLLRDDDKVAHTIDYALLYEQLCESLGVENVLALPFEALHEASTWEKLRAFTGIDNLGADVDLKVRDVNVKRKEGERDWRISKKAQPGAVRKQLIRVATKLQLQFLVHWLKKSIADSEVRIHISAQSSQAIMERYEKSNRRLAELTGIDLETYNYY